MPLDGCIPFLAYMHLWLPLLVVWELAWKGVALWRAGRNAHLVWFICLFIFNTLGILPIIYIFAFSQHKEGEIRVITAVPRPRYKKKKKR